MHYSVIRVESSEGMDRLRSVFPDGEANGMNFVLFSTSGVHGTYTTIEETEQEVKNGEQGGLTFLIVHPRLVTMQYGECYPSTEDDFAFLKRLRQSSSIVASKIGF